MGAGVGVDMRHVSVMMKPKLQLVSGLVLGIYQHILWKLIINVFQLIFLLLKKND